MNHVTPRESASVFATTVLGVTPHPSQVHFLETEAKVRVAACGRRFGKTTMGAMSCLHLAVRCPTTQLIIAPTLQQSKLLFDTARRMAADSVLADLIDKVVESPFPELTLATLTSDGREGRSVILARSVGHDAKYVRGLGADRVIADEAAFLPYMVLSQVIPPVLAASPFGYLDLYSTPFGTSGPFYGYYRRGLEGDPEVRSFHFRSSANPAITSTYLDRQRAEMTDLAFRTEYEAEFLDDQASVFRSDVVSAAIDLDIDSTPVEDHRYVIGYDPARYSDRSGVIVLDVTDEPFKVVKVEDLAGRPYLQQANTVRSYAQAYNDARVHIDSTSHDQLLEELQRQDVRVDGYRFTNESKQELIDGLVIALEHGRIRIPNHEDLIRELTYYRFERTAAGNVKLGAPAGAGHHDDLATALALAVHSARKPRVLVAGASDSLQEESSMRRRADAVERLMDLMGPTWGRF